MPRNKAATPPRSAQDHPTRRLLERAEREFPGVRDLEATYELIEKNAAPAIRAAQAGQVTVRVYSASGAD